MAKTIRWWIVGRDNGPEHPPHVEALRYGEDGKPKIATPPWVEPIVQQEEETLEAAAERQARAYAATLGFSNEQVMHEVTYTDCYACDTVNDEEMLRK